MFGHLVIPRGEYLWSRPACLAATLLACAELALVMPTQKEPSRVASNEPGLKSAIYLLPLWPAQRVQPRAEHVRFAAVGTGKAEGGNGRVVRKKPPRDTPAPPPPQNIAASAAPEPDTYEGSKVYIAPELQHPVSRDPSSDGPHYPDSLRAHGIEGLVVVRFIVDTGGHADSTTLRFVEASHPGFADAVRSALPRMRFIPAELDGRHVPQLVEQPFLFAIERRDTVPTPSKGHKRA